MIWQTIPKLTCRINTLKSTPTIHQTKISILGCGWLGMPLARHLVDLGFLVSGSTTQPKKLGEITSVGANAFMVDLTDPGTYDDGFFDTDVLVITVPPFREREAFYLAWSQLAHYIGKHPIRQIIMISSTSVYPDLNRVVTEKDADIHASTRHGVSLLETENILHDVVGHKLTVLRFGGLFGVNRHPVFYLAGRENLPGGHHPVNLIHLEDCIGIIETVINQKIVGTRLNACHPQHPTRRKYYSEMAQNLGLPIPTFTDDKMGFKEVSSELLIALTGYQFRRPLLTSEA